MLLKLVKNDKYSLLRKVLALAGILGGRFANLRDRRKTGGGVEAGVGEEEGVLEGISLFPPSATVGSTLGKGSSNRTVRSTLVAGRGLVF